MSVIHKQILRPGSNRLPFGAKPLHVHEQRGEVCVWYEQGPWEPVGSVTSSYALQVITTGGTVDLGWYYLGTAHLDSGSIVLHVYTRYGE